jgi:sucrose-6-phosphate hydrolase SacC (GH32 family)
MRDFSAYLFAHTTKEDYGCLHYSVSRDGLHWEMLNGGKRINEDYRGLPDICRGHDGRYYMTGKTGKSEAITIWVSEDLASWSKFQEFKPGVYETHDFIPIE